MAYFIELTTALECQKQLLMSSISNLDGRESLEIAVICIGTIYAMASHFYQGNIYSKGVNIHVSCSVLLLF